VIYGLVRGIKAYKITKQMYQQEDLNESTMLFVVDYLKNVLIVLKLHIVKIIQRCEHCRVEGVCENHRDLFNFLNKLEALRVDLENLTKKYFLTKETKKITN
jgi:hypothetical protein